MPRRMKAPKTRPGKMSSLASVLSTEGTQLSGGPVVSQRSPREARIGTNAFRGKKMRKMA